MPQLCKYGYSAAAASHRGRVRTSNEDAFGICAGDGLFVVCDGMGGAAAGEIASRVAVDTMLRSICAPSSSAHPTSTGQEPNSRETLNGASVECDSASGHPENGVSSLLREAVADANHLVFSQAANDARLHGMGTTLVALFAQDKSVWVAHVGDSRCYLFRDGKLEQLTHDHSLVDEQVKLGQLTREEADRSPLRNVITRAVGSQRSVTAEISEIEAEPGDVFLLCSDGLTRELSDARIQSILNGAKDLDLVCRQLIEAANDAGGRDNVTCILVQSAGSENS
ncbi:Protein serine/threonine phosphatase PrpC, regulation of stationary phase [Acidisarcina polymorpha]|uniref:Protein serine/threonine phosphatase PrpC, regulation of stationary phase n=1 Tax=Acidisarcina polymorpha TaxID=2211140 RepID=A0A2Z5FS73_9BACT|nr:Stp1/IreP family PP2C-type Ser/Thr phosphatase [Acidisarcina polymorpha]AXC09628.1 Protein serine/threonine phosphatase PrpC, regulation of stationary phase [Acidisarcina polymorpha]